MSDEEYDPDMTFKFTMKGLQHMLDRARLRHDIAEFEGDSEEAAHCLAEMMVITELSMVHGFDVHKGVLSEPPYNQEEEF